MNELATEDDIARSHLDPEFRKKLLASCLEKLLAALNVMRKNNPTDPKSVRQVKEGVDLAVKLADRLHEAERKAGGSQAA